jgi:hypothetical protein
VCCGSSLNAMMSPPRRGCAVRMRASRLAARRSCSRRADAPAVPVITGSGITTVTASGATTSVSGMTAMGDSGTDADSTASTGAAVESSPALASTHIRHCTFFERR